MPGTDAMCCATGGWTSRTCGGRWWNWAGIRFCVTCPTSPSGRPAGVRADTGRRGGHALGGDSEAFGQPPTRRAPLSPHPTASLICGANTTYKFLSRGPAGCRPGPGWRHAWPPTAASPACTRPGGACGPRPFGQRRTPASPRVSVVFTDLLSIIPALGEGSLGPWPNAAVPAARRGYVPTDHRSAKSGSTSRPGSSAAGREAADTTHSLPITHTGLHSRLRDGAPRWSTRTCRGRSAGSGSDSTRHQTGRVIGVGVP